MARLGQGRGHRRLAPPVPGIPPPGAHRPPAPLPTHPSGAPQAHGNDGDMAPRCQCPLRHGQAKPPAQGHRGSRVAQTEASGWLRTPLPPEPPLDGVPTPETARVEEALQGLGGLQGLLGPGGFRKVTGHPKSEGGGKAGQGSRENSTQGCWGRGCSRGESRCRDQSRDGGETGETHPFQHLDEAQGLQEAAPAHPAQDTVLRGESGGSRGTGRHRAAPGRYGGPGGLIRGARGLQ